MDWIFIICFLFCYVQLMRTQSCQCDLTGGKCDTNCACDGDCSAEDKLTFTQYISENQNRIEELCKSEILLYSANGKYPAQGNGAGLFCVFKDNYEARHLYKEPESVSSSAAFQRISNKFHVKNVIPDRTDDNNFQNSFKIGDPMFIFDNNNKKGYLPQPTSFVGSECESRNIARFLYPNKTSCYRTVRDLQKECETNPSWNSDKYINGFKVAPYPSFICAGSNSSHQNCDRLIKPTLELPLLCQKNGVSQECPFATHQEPKLNGTDCENVVLQVHYDIIYNINTTAEITEVRVSFLLGNIPSTTSSFKQTFSYQFIQNGVQNSTVVSRSGNPGYIVGRVILTQNVQKNETSEGDADHFSVMKASGAGQCSNDSRQSVQFGLDYQSGCFLNICDNTTQDTCVALQESILAMLVKDVPSRVGAFGNAIKSKDSDWISTIDDGPKNKPSYSNGQCNDMITDVTFEFLYARTGYVANPQNKIVGFQVNYGQPRTLSQQCSGLPCTSCLKVIVTQSVVFIDVSSTAVAEVKPKPKFRSKAPNDFFYPFM